MAPGVTDKGAGVAYQLADERVRLVGVEGDGGAKEVVEGDAEERGEGGAAEGGDWRG